MKRNALQENTFELNQAKIMKALSDAKYSGLTRKELMDKTGIKNRVTLRTHLKIKQDSIAQGKGPDGENRLYLNIYYEKLKTNGLQIHEAWSKFSSQMFDLAQAKGAIPINSDSAGDFFSKHGVLLYPEPNEKGFDMRFVFCTLEKQDGKFDIKFLWRV